MGHNKLIIVYDFLFVVHGFVLRMSDWADGAYFAVYLIFFGGTALFFSVPVVIMCLIICDFSMWLLIILGIVIDQLIKLAVVSTFVVGEGCVVPWPSYYSCHESYALPSVCLRILSVRIFIS